MWEEKRSLLPKNRWNELESSSSTTDSPVRRFFLTYFQKVKNWAFVTTPFSHPLARSYLYLRGGIGIIGVALPVVLVIATMILNLSFNVKDSVSSYYYTPTGDVFVGSLWAIGIFLICYQYDHLDNIVGNIAGVCAIGLSLFPTPPDCPLTNLNCATELQKKIGVAHFVFSTGFLLALFIMVFFLFTRGNPEKVEVTEADRKRKRRNNIVYRICGIAMAACILLAALLLFVPYLSDDQWHKQVHPILIIEFIATEAFGIAWFVKGQTLGRLKAAIQRPPFRRHAKSDQSAAPSQPSVEQPNGLPATPFQPTVDGQ